MTRQKNMSEMWFWILSIFWGADMTLIGGIAAAILTLKGYNCYKYHYSYVFEVGYKWGGLTLGPVIIINKNPDRELLNHEFGHSLQNCYFGNCMVWISLWSAARYWFREFIKKDTYSLPSFLRPFKSLFEGYELPSYDSIWFEGTATFLGNRFDKGRV